MNIKLRERIKLGKNKRKRKKEEKLSTIRF